MVKQLVPRTRAGNTWTEARYWQFIRSALRQAYSRYPVKFQVKKEAERTVEGCRHKYEYQCAECSGWFTNKEIQVDHIEPAGKLSNYKDLAGFVKRLFCEADGMQVLCLECHQSKTNAERKARKKA